MGVVHSTYKHRFQSKKSQTQELPIITARQSMRLLIGLCHIHGAKVLYTKLAFSFKRCWWCTWSVLDLDSTVTMHYTNSTRTPGQVVNMLSNTPQHIHSLSNSRSSKKPTIEISSNRSASLTAALSSELHPSHAWCIRLRYTIQLWNGHIFIQWVRARSRRRGRTTGFDTTS